MRKEYKEYKSFSRKNQRYLFNKTNKKYNTRKYNTRKYNTRKYKIPTTKKEFNTLKSIVKKRKEWMYKYMNPYCFECDANCKSHQGRIDCGKRQMDKYTI
jgi:hypothetical protein